MLSPVLFFVEFWNPWSYNSADDFFSIASVLRDLNQAFWILGFVEIHRDRSTETPKRKNMGDQ